MKTMRKVLAWVLAIMMMTGSVCALAETVEYDDLQLLEVVSVEDGGDPLLRVEAKNPDGTWEDTDFETKELTVKAGDLSNAEEGPRGPLYVEADGQKVTVETGDVEQKVTDETGDAEQEDVVQPAVSVTTNGEEDSELTVKTGAVTSVAQGVSINNAGGDIDVTLESVDAEKIGVEIGTMTQAQELIDSDEKTIQAFLEEAGENVHFFDTLPDRVETDDPDKPIITFDRTYWVDGDDTAYVVRYEWSWEKNDNNLTNFWITEVPNSEGTTDVTVEKGVTVIGQSAVGISAQSTVKGQDITVTVGEDVTAKKSGEQEAPATAISARSGDDFTEFPGGQVTVTVEGKAIAECGEGGSDNGFNTRAVDVTAYGEGSEVNVTIGKGAEGIVDVNALEGGTAEVTIQAGGITAKGDALEIQNGDYRGEEGTTLEGGTIRVTVTGDVTSEKSDVVTVQNISGTTEVTVTGDVTVKGYGEAIDTCNEAGETKITVVGDITGGKGGEDRAGGIAAGNYGGKTTIDVTGDVKTEAYADNVIYGESSDGTLSITVTGNVESANGDGISAVARGKDAETDLTITGNVTANSKNDATVVLLEVEELGDISALFAGDVTAKGEKSTGDWFTGSTGMYVNNRGGTIEATVIGDVSATGADVNRGIVIEAEDLTEYEIDKELVELDVDLTGSQQYDHDDVLTEEGITEVFIYNGQLYRAAGDGKYQKVNEKKNDTKSTTSLTVIGDVSGDYGAEIKVTDNQTATLVVDGTLSGKEAAVILDGEETVIGENVDLAVWKLESESADGTLILSTERDEETGEITEAPNAAAEKAVRYIVKVMDSWMSTLNFKSILGSGTVTVGSGDDATEYHTALQDEDVKLKISLAEDQELEGIYFDGDNLLSGDNLKQDGEGNFLVKMLRGGGMLLGLKVGHKHTMEKHAAVNETSTTDGNSEYYYCTSCKKYFSDADGKTEIQKDSWVIKAAGGGGAYDPTGKGKLLPYEDVEETDWFYDAVLYCYQKGYLDHISNSETEFGPADEVTRAAGVYILWVMAGKPVSEYDGQFSDVPDGKWYTDAIMWAAVNGYMKGHEDGRFGLGDPMPLEELIIALWCMAGCPEGAGDLSGFSDVEQISPWAREAMSWAVGAGIIEGGDDGSLNAGSNFRKSTLTKIIMDYENIAK